MGARALEVRDDGERVDAGSFLGPAWWRELGEDWFRALARRRRSPATRMTYLTPLRHLGKWLEVHEVDDAGLLDRHHLQAWQDSLVDQVGPKTQSVYATAVRGLLRWGGREERVRPGLADWIDTPEVPESEPLVLEPEQLTAVVERYRDPRGDLQFFRDRALFWFLFTSSARISEVLRLDLAHLDRRRWVVVQKGGSEKTLVISTMARAWLEHYLRVRGQDQEPAMWVYIGPLVGRRRLTRRDANRIWRGLCTELGIPPFTSRWLRGTSATELNELGNSSIDAAHHLGHRDLGSIMRYAKLRPKRRQDMVDGLDRLLPPPAFPPAIPPTRHGRPRPRRSGA